jgi:ABC-type multidrug transport system fused ATPase/permease subunit
VVPVPTVPMIVIVVALIIVIVSLTLVVSLTLIVVLTLIVMLTLSVIFRSEGRYWKQQSRRYGAKERKFPHHLVLHFCHLVRSRSD